MDKENFLDWQLKLSQVLLNEYCKAEYRFNINKIPDENLKCRCELKDAFSL